MIGLLLLITILISVWQLNVYNDARSQWEATLERLSRIANVRQDSTILVLVTHRVAFTQAPFRYLDPESIRYATDSIAVSAAALSVSRDNLLGEAQVLSKDDPLSIRLRQSVEYMDELISMADECVSLGLADEWVSAQSVITTVAEDSTVPRFEKIHTDLVGELRRAQILLQQDHVRAQELMAQAGRTSIIVTALAAGGVIVLGVILSFNTIRSIIGPIRQLSEAAARLAEGKFETRVPVVQEDELGQLAQVFNYMAGELDEIYSSMEERAGTAEARLLQAIEGIPEGFVLFDAEDRLILHNEKYREMRPEVADLIVPGAHFEDLIRSAAERGSYPDVKLRVEDWVADRMERHRNPRGPFDIELSDGRWLQVSEYKTQEGGLLGIRVDITERKRAEEELRRAKEAAETAKEVMSEFVANASHELRTPLTHIYGFAKMIQKDMNRRIFPRIKDKDRRTSRAIEESGESIEIIVEEGERMANLIKDMLDLAKIEAGKFEWDMQPLSVIDVIDRAVATTSYLFEEKDLELIKDYQPGLPEIIGDRDGLIRVLLNLISNAVKFTEKGSVTCLAKRQDDEIIVSVIDSGIGIKKEDHEKVFEKFAQAGDPHTDRSKGTGLGLPISKQIVENHGGRIWLESEPGKGSNFTFALPLLTKVEN
jgi:signal transduction histidine kinase